jgi:hypothetical protein
MPSQKGGLFGLTQSNSYGLYGEPSYTTETGVSTGVIQYLYYFIMLTVIILLILVLVNYLITPIFRTTPGGKGFIPVPGMDDVSVYWKAEKGVKILKDTEIGLGATTENWSYIVDIIVDNPTSNTNYPRVLLTRGNLMATPSGTFKENDTIRTIAPNFNTIVYLDRLTNDLNVAVQLVQGSGANQTTIVEQIVIPNVPVRKPIRLGVMVGSKVLEVYVNGLLVRSKTYTLPIRSTRGDIQPPNDAILSSTARVANLRVFNYPLSPAQFRAYGGPDAIPLKPLPPDSCAK